jgi:hypothetical protein
MFRKSIYLLVIPLILAACASQGAGQVTPTTEKQTPTREKTGVNLEATPAFPPAVQAAAQRLATTQNVDLQEIEVMDYESENWSDSCLGLAQPGEMCLQVITPGWRIEFQSNGEKFVYHTDKSGDSLRLAFSSTPVEPPPSDFSPGEELPPAVQAAVDKLSQIITIDPEIIEVVSAQQTTWSDSCLGLGGPDELCLQVITPGWKVTLSAQGKEYELHTNEDGSSVRLRQFSPPSSNPSRPVIQKARKALSAKMGIPIGKVELVTIDQVDWSNACLELQHPDEMCAMVITPGYRIVFQAGGTEYELHTDLNADQIRIK